MLLSVVMPCYNEASRGDFFKRLDLVRKYASEYEVILVDDGSWDSSAYAFRHFVDMHGLTNWRVVSYENNKGKGYAVKVGVDEAVGDYILIMDADLSVHPKNITKVVEIVNDRTCCIASRYRRGSCIVNRRSFSRRALSWCSRVAVKLLFGLKVTDTQCGFKIFPSDELKHSTIYTAGGWLYDVELLLNMKAMGVDIIELPVRWENMEGESTLKPLKAAVSSLSDLFCLLRNKRKIFRR